MKQATKVFEYLISYVIGFVVVTFSDITMTTLALACVGLGFLTSALLAGTIYLFAYTALRASSAISNAIGSSGEALSSSLGGLSQVIVTMLNARLMEQVVEEKDPDS
jgi:hypothetical protein